MKVSNSTIIPTVLSLLLGSSWTMAGEHALDPSTEPGASASSPPEFSELDADENGSISISEAGEVPVLVQQFTQIDMDGDGGLSEEEYAIVVPPGTEDEEGGT